MSIETAKLDDYAFRLGSHELKPLMLGGMGVNISTKALALEVARLGGVGHLSDAMLPDVDDRELGTHFTAEKAKRFRTMAGLDPKPDMHFRLEDVERAARLYVEDVMKEKRGSGLVFLNCMEKLTMNDARGTLKSRLNAALDAGIDGISLSAGLHTSSFSLMEENPRFRDAYLGIVVSSVRALKIFLRRSSKTNRLPDYVVVEGPLAGGHLGFGDDWSQYNLEDIVRDVKKYLADNGMAQIPVFAAGGIFTGGDAVHMLRDVGADGVQVATRFTIAKECGLPDDVKQRYIDAKPEDVEVNHFSTTGYPMRMLKYSPAKASDIRPNCEAYGYLLSNGQCSYIKEWHARKGAKEEGLQVPEHTKCCLCTHMRNYKVWTCGATVSRLKETTVRLADGSWYLPTARQIYEDYMTSTAQHIAVARPEE